MYTCLNSVVASFRGYCFPILSRVGLFKTAFAFPFLANAESKFIQIVNAAFSFALLIFFTLLLNSTPALSGGVNQPPVVNITNLQNNSTIPGPLPIATVAADASDADGSITQVEFFANGGSLGVDNTAPYSVDVPNVAAGTYAVTAVATDNNNASTTSVEIVVTITDGAVGNVPPTVVLTNLEDGAQIPGPLPVATVTADAADTDGTITQVEFFSNGGSLGVDTTPPYSVDVPNVGAGTYAVTAVATDNNNESTTSTEVVVTVTDPAAVNTAPTITLTTPANNANYVESQPINMTATAADSDGTVTQVQFYGNGGLLATDTTAPYSYTLPNAPVGVYNIVAVATDDDGATATSAGSNITVNTVQAVDVGYKYDALGRIIRVEYPNGTAIRYQYDALGNREESQTEPR